MYFSGHLTKKTKAVCANLTHVFSWPVLNFFIVCKMRVGSSEPGYEPHMAVSLSLSVVSYEHNYYRHKLIGFMKQWESMLLGISLSWYNFVNSVTSITTLRPVELESCWYTEIPIFHLRHSNFAKHRYLWNIRHVSILENKCDRTNYFRWWLTDELLWLDIQYFYNDMV
jgi:hypothetical protein